MMEDAHTWLECPPDSSLNMVKCTSLVGLYSYDNYIMLFLILLILILILLVLCKCYFALCQVFKHSLLHLHGKKL